MDAETFTSAKNLLPKLELKKQKTSILWFQELALKTIQRYGVTGKDRGIIFGFAKKDFRMFEQVVGYINDGPPPRNFKQYFLKLWKIRRLELEEEKALKRKED